MQGRSWMAALTLAAGTVASLVAPAAADEPAMNRVRLELAIAGLGRDGCDVEIKPANPAGCRFSPVSRHVKVSGKASLTLDDVQTSSADRECAFEITIREPGQAVRTVRRGLRLAASQPGVVSSLTCYLSSPSKVARAEQLRERR